MKGISLLMVAASFLLSISAFSADDSCKKVSNLARDAMKARQSDDLLQDSIGSIGDGSKFAQAVVMKAYEKPVVNDHDGKEQAVKEFQNEAYRVCFNANN